MNEHFTYRHVCYVHHSSFPVNSTKVIRTMAGHLLFSTSITAANKRRNTAKDLVSVELKQNATIESIQLQYSYCCFRTSYKLVIGGGVLS